MEHRTVPWHAERREDCALADDRPIREVVAVLVGRYGLPPTAEAGQPIPYGLYHHAQARLSGEQTLAQMGVTAGAVLYTGRRAAAVGGSVVFGDAALIGSQCGAGAVVTGTAMGGWYSREHRGWGGGRRWARSRVR